MLLAGSAAQAGDAAAGDAAAGDAAAGDAGFAYDQRLGNQVPLAVHVRDEQGKTTSLGQVLGHRPAILALGAFRPSGPDGEVRDDLMDALARLDGLRGYSLIFLSI